MMKYCPRCKNFYEDNLLRFCLNEGAPLVEIDDTSQLWSEGKIFVREANRQIVREARTRRIKTILKTVVLMVLVIMIMSVITLRSWVYLNKPADETAQNPKPTSKPEIANETPNEIISAGLETPTPSPKRTPTSTATASPSPTISPTPLISPTIKKEVCGAKEKETVRGEIIAAKKSPLEQDILNSFNEKAQKYFWEKHEILRVHRAGVYNSKPQMTVDVISCKNAKVSIRSEFYPTIKLDAVIKISPYQGALFYDCLKSNNGWNCILTN